MREDQIEEVNAAANRYEDAHRHAVDHHVFNNELSGGEHEHADEGGSGNQVGVAVGGEHLPRDIGCDETQKGERSTRAVATAMQTQPPPSDGAASFRSQRRG